LSPIDPLTRRVLVTGVGYREEDDASSEGNVFDSPGVKPNMGSAVALQVVRAGYAVVITARTERKLDRVRQSISQYVPSAEIIVRPTNILDPDSVERLVHSIPSDRELDLVQSAGLSAGGYELPDGNPYLPVDKMPLDLPTLEFNTVVKGLLTIVKAFLPTWRRQSETRVVVISSMSGIRAYPLGYAHASAKAGLHHAVRSLCLELAKERIYVSEVNPGAVNTGFYDPPSVRSAVVSIGRDFGYDYSETGIPQIPPISIGDAAVLCLTSAAHILSINAVARGQFPHHGA